MLPQLTKLTTMFSALPVFLLALSLSLPSSLPSVSASNPPSASLKYKRQVIANAQFVWGLNAPIAVFAGQIQAESAWNPSARSPYASGLAQFTPDTADWISHEYPDLTSNQPLEPTWAIRALVRYDLLLFLLHPTALNACNQWGFTLSAYNGGEGNLDKDIMLTASLGQDTSKWFGAVEGNTLRSHAAMVENRAYPRKILFNFQPLYSTWGPLVPCSF